MTKIHIVSDPHDDFSRVHFGNWQLPNVGADVVVVGGDIAGRGSTMGRDWLQAQQSRLGVPFIVVFGNHDFWRGSIDREVDRFRERLQSPHIHLLDGDAVIVEGVRFVGGTLWTDYGIAGDPNVAAHVAMSNMNDFRYMRSGTGQVRPRAMPRDLKHIHERHREAIRRTLEEPFPGPTVVVTHHAPSARSLREGRVREPLDAAYASDLEDLIIEGRPELWIHGHVHTRHDYTIGDTRIVCNPRGYVSWQQRFGVGAIDQENERFDENLVIDVKRRPRPIPDGFEVEEGQLTYGGQPLGPVDDVLDEMERADFEERRADLMRRIYADRDDEIDMGKGNG